MKKTISYLYVILGAACWGFIGLFNRMLGEAGVSVWNRVFIRNFISLVLLTVVFALFHRQVFRIKLKHLPIFLAARLLVFALLSEIPFNLMNSGMIWDPYDQNVLWTLLLGALVCWLMDWALKKCTPLSFMLTGAVMLAAYWLLEIGNTDYGGWGMLLVAAFYGVHRAPSGAVVKMIAQAFGLAFFSLGVMGGYLSIELWSLVSLAPIWLYNGQRGFSHKAVQYGFYAFYPVHILILSLIAMYRY